MESVASSPRGSRLSRVEDDSCSPWQVRRQSDIEFELPVWIYLNTLCPCSDISDQL